MVLLVQSNLFPLVDGSVQPTYLVDVGFGGYVPPRPILLLAGPVVAGSAPLEEFRLTRGYHPNSSLELTPELSTSTASVITYPPEWLLLVRCGASIPDWRVAYQFSIAETFPEDHQSWNYTLHRDVEGPAAAPFWASVLVVKHYVVEEDDAIVGESVRLGKIYLVGNQVVKRVGDDRQVILTVKSEFERVRALKEYCGIEISDDDIVHIQGRASALVE